MLKKKLTAMGLTVEFMSHQELGKRERTYTQVWSKIIQDSGFIAKYLFLQTTPASMH